MTYQTKITETLKSQGATEIDSRHVEGIMRSELGTLDHLSPAAFKREVANAVAAIRELGHALAEQIARSYGI